MTLQRYVRPVHPASVLISLRIFFSVRQRQRRTKATVGRLIAGNKEHRSFWDFDGLNHEDCLPASQHKISKLGQHFSPIDFPLKLYFDVVLW
jgi:hypothetical protein